MIDNPLFPSIHSAEDYLACSGENEPYVFESQSTVYIQKSGEETCEQYRIACTLDSVIMLDDETSVPRAMSIWMKFCKIDIERNKKLLNSMRVDGDDFLFNMSDDAKGFLNFVEQRNSLIEKALADGLAECASIAGWLYGSGLETPVRNLIEMTPEEVFVYPDAYGAMLWALAWQNSLFTEYICYSREDIEKACAIISSGNNRLVFDQIQEQFSGFADILREDYAVNDYFAPLVVFLLVEKGAVSFFAERWVEDYDPTPQYASAEDYIASCVDSNRIDASSVRDISILAYFAMSREAFACDSYPDSYERVLDIVQERQQDVARGRLKERLFSDCEHGSRKTLTIDDIDLMSGPEFESAVCALFKAMGYAVHATRQSGDQGIDVIAEKGSVKIGIQAKCYASAVGNAAVQEAVAGKVFYGCGKAMVVTNSTFTKSAVELAAANGVILWGRDILMQKLIDYPVTI